VPLPPAATLSDDVRGFLGEPHFAVLATSGADGTAHQAVIWYRLDPDGLILINSRSPRRWPAELQREPRCSLAVMDEADPFRWVGIAGVVEQVVDEVDRAREDIVELAIRYDDAAPERIAAFRSQPRISFRIRIVGVHDHLEDPARPVPAGIEPATA
jgi:PPOX class probable F420-dependent enzyme